MATHADMSTDEFEAIIEKWIATARHPFTCLYVHHTDAVREWAYDHPSAVGELDKGLEQAKIRGWSILSMKDDWKTIYPPAK